MHKQAGNAYKHGLAAAKHRDELGALEIEGLTLALCTPDGGAHLRNAAAAVAHSFIECRRVESLKTALVEHQRAIRGRKEHFWIDRRSDGDHVLGCAFAYCDAHQQLKRMHRYERRAHSRFRRALRDYFFAQELEMRAVAAAVLAREENNE